MAKRRSKPEPFSLPPDASSVNLLFFDAIWSEREHLAGRHEFLWMRKGRLALEAGGRRAPARVGDFLFIPVGTPHRDCFDVAEPCEVLLIQFAWPPWDDELAARLGAGVLAGRSEETRREAAHLLDLLFAEAARAGTLHRPLLNALLHAALLKLLEPSETRLSPLEGAEAYRDRKSLHLVREARRYLAANFHRRLTLTDVARELRISPFYLSRLFGEASGETLHDHLLSLRLGRAEALLLEGELTVSQIAHATGFGNGNYFAKVFKKHRGRNPKDFLSRRPASKT